jgi:hypothetical protein
VAIRFDRDSEGLISVSSAVRDARETNALFTRHVHAIHVRGEKPKMAKISPRRAADLSGFYQIRPQVRLRRV